MKRTVISASLTVVGALFVVGGWGLAHRAHYAHGIHPVTGLPLTTPGKVSEGTLLFNGWTISPAGRSLTIGDMPEGGAISPDGSTLAIVNCGFNAHHVYFLDLKTEQIVATLPVSRLGSGLVWSAAGDTVYASGGIANGYSDVYTFKKGVDGKWERSDGFKIECSDRQKRRITGLALSHDGSVLYALNQYDNTLYAVDLSSGKTVSHLEVGDHPTACTVSIDGAHLWIANQGSGEVVSVNIAKPGLPVIEFRVKTGSHPNDVAQSQDGRLFVSCANSDCVSVIDEKSGKCVDNIRTATSAASPAGSTPNALAVSRDGKLLCVADADDNDVCVVDISNRTHSHVSGFIPTGWYPTAVAIAPDGRIIVGTGKGGGTGPNHVTLPIRQDTPSNFEHHGRQLTGSLSFVDTPDSASLASFTQQVRKNSPYADRQLRVASSSVKSVIPTRVGSSCPIKHVLYIIRENRTYDQVFGDVQKGNGDARLCLFGREVTPNNHALAEQFVLLDNLYCSGEVSQDGHPWSVSASCTDFTQRAWVLSYSGKGDTMGSDSVEDPAAGFIWQACKRKGLTVRAYGEYAWHPTLSSESCEEFIGKGKPGSAPPGRDMDKAAIFLNDFKELAAKNAVPNLMIMSLGEDHTSGTSPGAHTPKAMVGSNDQAVGRIVEGISHSALWGQFAIFVIEDDAQNGPDHVDSHRTEGLVVSPYVHRGMVDSTMYSTASMLRTIELILGVKPMTRYDASATPMFAAFGTKPDLQPYTCLPPGTDLAAVNKRTDYGARVSAAMDFRGYDRADPRALNEILWHSIKGKDSPMPAPVTSKVFSASRHPGQTAGKLEDRDD